MDEKTMARTSYISQEANQLQTAEAQKSLDLSTLGDVSLVGNLRDLSDEEDSMEDRIQAGLLFNNIVANRRIRSYFDHATESLVIQKETKKLEELWMDYVVPGMDCSEPAELEEIFQWIKARRSIAQVFRKLVNEKRSEISSLLFYDK